MSTLANSVDPDEMQHNAAEMLESIAVYDRVERSGPKSLKLLFSNQLSMKFVLLLSVKLPTIVGIEHL